MQFGIRNSPLVPRGLEVPEGELGDKRIHRTPNSSEPVKDGRAYSELLRQEVFKIKIATSILAADITSLKEEIERIEEAGADLVHIDIMDGVFTPNITFGPEMVRAIRKITELPLDVHLMINNPQKFVKPFLQAGSDILTVHIEASGNIEEAIGLIKEGNKKAGIAINPKTPLHAIEEL